MEKQSVVEYCKESLELDCDKFAMDVVSGIFRESAHAVGKDGDGVEDFLARVGAFVSCFIEASQESVKENNPGAIAGFLGAIRFRYCGTCSQKKGN